MQYKVRILQTAWEDLKRIEDWYLIQFGAETALKVSDNILNSIERLEIFPDSGSLTPDNWLNTKGFKMMICGKHASIYKKIKNEIFVYHIVDTQTEYTKLFY